MAWQAQDCSGFGVKVLRFRFPELYIFQDIGNTGGHGMVPPGGRYR